MKVMLDAVSTLTPRTEPSPYAWNKYAVTQDVSFFRLLLSALRYRFLQ